MTNLCHSLGINIFNVMMTNAFFSLLWILNSNTRIKQTNTINNHNAYSSDAREIFKKKKFRPIELLKYIKYLVDFRLKFWLEFRLEIGFWLEFQLSFWLDRDFATLRFQRELNYDF